MSKALGTAVAAWLVAVALVAGFALTRGAGDVPGACEASGPAGREPFAVVSGYGHKDAGIAPEQPGRPDKGASEPDGGGLCADENALIEAALVAQGYFRADVPLSFSLQDHLHTACEAGGVPYHVALGLIEVESGFDAEAVSPVGCYGLCQLNPDYFPNGLTPAQNIEAGIEYLGSLLARYGCLDAALCGYHDGHDTGRRGYSDAVLEAAEQWR